MPNRPPSALGERRTPLPTVVPNGLLSVDRLSAWRRNTLLEKALFTASEFARLGKARRLDPGKLTIASVAWECPWARSGGVATIAKLLPEAVEKFHPAERTPPRIVRLGPFHRTFDLQACVERDGVERRMLETPRATATVRFDDQDFSIEVFEATTRKGETWYLMRDRDRRFFQADGGRPRGTLPDGRPRAGTDPYFYSEETSAEQRDSIDSRLLRDALFFAKAVPAALHGLGHTENLIVHAHDWTASALALTVKEELAREDGRLKSALIAFTFHNPFDHVVIDPRRQGARPSDGNQLATITSRVAPEQWIFPFEVDAGMKKPRPDTLLECMLGLFDGPIAIVSPGFAAEVCGTPESPPDPLQRHHFAPHLVSPLNYQGAVGIQNPNFYPPEDWRLYPKESIAAILDRGDAGPILAEKERRQESLLPVLEALGAVTDPRIRVNGRLDPAGESTVYFHMYGRLDPSQKGFDVLANAIELYGREHPEADARFILTPLINGLEPEAFYQQLVNLAQDHRGKVLMVEGHLERIKDVQAGVGWSVWPSLYEPCGAATEPLAMGTPLVVRGTGGLTRQVQYGEERCGLLYRESVPAGTDAGREWQSIEKAASPADRMKIGLYRSMVDELKKALVEAVRIRTTDPRTYARMLALASLQVQSEFFSPKRFAHEYWSLYETMQSAGASPEPGSV